MQVTVYQNQVEQALKGLKRLLSKEGLFRELKRRRFYVKPSLRKKMKIKEAKKKPKRSGKTRNADQNLYGAETNDYR